VPKQNALPLIEISRRRMAQIHPFYPAGYQRLPKRRKSGQNSNSRQNTGSNRFAARVLAGFRPARLSLLTVA